MILLLDLICLIIFLTNMNFYVIDFRGLEKKHFKTGLGFIWSVLLLGDNCICE